MGTRNLTMVIDQNGTKKVAQYGQWDGYPSGVGAGIVIFLQNKPLFDLFKSKLHRVRFLEPEGRDKEFVESYDKNTPAWSHELDNRTEAQRRWYSTYMHRDLAEEVLTNIANSEDEEILLDDSEETARGGGWVEYSYVINLQDNTLSCYHKLDKPPFKVYSIDELPDFERFTAECEAAEDALRG
jgi:hypothetical protein